MNKRILTIGATLVLLTSPVLAQDTNAVDDTVVPSRSERLDRRGDRIEERRDARGDRIERKLDRRGNQIDRRMDRSGRRADARLDRRAARAARRGN